MLSKLLCIYTRNKVGKVLIVVVYVDDLLVIGNCKEKLVTFKTLMNKRFEMSDLGLPSYSLGIEVIQFEGGINLKLEAFARQILERIKTIDCNSTKCPIDQKLQLKKDEEGELVNPTE